MNDSSPSVTPIEPAPAPTVHAESVPVVALPQVAAQKAVSERPATLGFVGFGGLFIGIADILMLSVSVGFTAPQSDTSMTNAAVNELIFALCSAVVTAGNATFLIIASVGILSLRFWSRKMMVVMVALELLLCMAKLPIGFWYWIPKWSNVIANAPPAYLSAGLVRDLQQNLREIKRGMIVFNVLTFVIPFLYGLLALKILHQPHIRRWFEKPAIGRRGGGRA